MSSESRAGTGAAFGKLILLGEHAVVYGAPALVAGIERQCRATARVAGDQRRLSLLGRRCQADEDPELAAAFKALLEQGGAPEQLQVEVEGELPPGVGLGFSAAAAVAIARAVEALAGETIDRKRVRARAMAWERVFHGNPSGVDVAAAMQGGCSRFVRGSAGEPLTRVLAVKRRPHLCLGLTGTRSSTKEMVEAVAKLRRRQPDMVQRTVDGIAALVENAVSAVEAGELIALGELMNLNQMLLAGLHVSGDDIEQLCAAAREAGALGAKLTGAGGGGAVVALAGSGPEGQDIADGILQAWRMLGFDGFQTELG